jgi:hypothetical protein
MTMPVRLDVPVFRILGSFDDLRLADLPSSRIPVRLAFGLSRDDPVSETTNQRAWGAIKGSGSGAGRAAARRAGSGASGSISCSCSAGGSATSACRRRVPVAACSWRKTHLVRPCCAIVLHENRYEPNVRCPFQTVVGIHAPEGMTAARASLLLQYLQELGQVHRARKRRNAFAHHDATKSHERLSTLASPHFPRCCEPRAPKEFWSDEKGLFPPLSGVWLQHGRHG